MLFCVTIASIFGHRTDTMISFISINQSCHIEHNAAVKVAINCIETYFKAEEELQKMFIWNGSWFPDHDKKTQIPY